MAASSTYFAIAAPLTPSHADLLRLRKGRAQVGLCQVSAEEGTGEAPVQEMRPAPLRRRASGTS